LCLILALISLNSAPLTADELPFWRRIVENRLEKIRSGEVRAPVLRWQQVRSLQYVHFQPDYRSRVLLPGAEEIEPFRQMRKGKESEALDYLDEFFGERNDLKALAVRDTDRDGVPDYRVSDYFGKFLEGDVDVDGDGIRNVLDSHPYDTQFGGRDSDGDGIPDVAGSFSDENGNGVPDHVDWGVSGLDPEHGEIQRRMLQTHGIALVDRNAEFDLPLMRAVDDAVGKVFRAYFKREPVMPTLRTIAVEKSALLGKLLSTVAEDNTSAQVFSQTQSLTIYSEGRDIPHDIGLLGLLVHEIGHNYHMSLDFMANDLETENVRTRFNAPAFTHLIASFGWVREGYYEGEFPDVLPTMPRFAYTGISEPLFRYNGRTPEQWNEWLWTEYEKLGGPPDYLEQEPFRSRYIVSDYSLTSPYEWYGDNLLAYVIMVLEREALVIMASQGRASESEAARQRITDALREIWPGFFHRSIAPDVADYFERLFPIAPRDRVFLARRYIYPILEGSPG
jgi:hypothetical protein